MMPTPSWLPRLVRLSRRAYFADFFITPPITAVFAILSLRHDFGLGWIAWFSVGWIAWTLVEYAVHRASHHLPWLKDLHGLHHRDPKDYIALHPAATLMLYGLSWLIFGTSATPFFVGYSVGYVVYAAVHTAIHYAGSAENGWLRGRAEEHRLHHKFGSCCFGVTTSFWDTVFWTGF